MTTEITTLLVEQRAQEAKAAWVIAELEKLRVEEAARKAAEIRRAEAEAMARQIAEAAEAFAANMRLRDAAGDLLHALACIVDAIELPDALSKMARAAITKATGQ